MVKRILFDVEVHFKVNHIFNRKAIGSYVLFRFMKDSISKRFIKIKFNVFRVVKVRLKPLEFDKDILNTIFYQFPVACNLTPIGKKRINKLLVDFAKSCLIARSEAGPYIQPMSSIFY